MIITGSDRLDMPSSGLAWHQSRHGVQKQPIVLASKLNAAWLKLVVAARPEMVQVVVGHGSPQIAFFEHCR